MICHLGLTARCLLLSFFLLFSFNFMKLGKHIYNYINSEILTYLSCFQLVKWSKIFTNNYFYLHLKVTEGIS